MDVNEVTECNFDIKSKMLHKDHGGCDLVRADFTSIVHFVPAAKVDILCRDGNLAAQKNFTGQRDLIALQCFCVRLEAWWLLLCVFGSLGAGAAAGCRCWGRLEVW